MKFNKLNIRFNDGCTAHRWAGVIALAVLVTAPCAGAAGDANLAASYAVRAPLVLAADAPLQRLVLPAPTLMRLQTAGYSDVRIFNAQGQAVPMALTQVVGSTQTQRQQVTLSALPIFGATGAMDSQGMSLRIEEQQGKRIVKIDTTNSNVPSNTKNLVGALLDARSVSAPVVDMVLDVDLPAGLPISFDIQASKDLKNWRTVADTVLFRTADTVGKDNLGTQRMQLSMSDLKDYYLRITWQDANGQAAAVALRGATLTTALSTISNPRVTSLLTTPLLTSPHELSFVLPFVTPLAALKIKPQGTNVLVPVRVLGRNDRSQAWTPLASAVLFNLVTNGKEQNNAAIELQGAQYREIKIEADKKTVGFATAPQVSVQFDPAQIVFLASGAAPFTLAAGLEAAVASYLPIASLMPNYQSGQENTLPLARLEVSAADAGAALATTAQSTSSTPPTRSLILWGVLLLGVLLLGLMAWALMKPAKQSNQPS